MLIEADTKENAVQLYQEIKALLQCGNLNKWTSKESVLLSKILHKDGEFGPL